jgi:HEAT repeat protein
VTLAAEPEAPPPFPPAPIEEMLRLFVKAVRAHQLYLPNNPVYKSAIDAVRVSFEPIWKQTDEIALKFGETDIRWAGRPVLAEQAKSADSLPWTFFKDGVREIHLSRGFEGAELSTLFDILRRVRKATPDEDDLLTLLWEADFTSLRYRYVDIGAEPVAPVADGTEVSQPPSPDGVAAAAREAIEESRPAVVNMQDFDATLYFLDEKELSYLKEEIEREYSGDLRMNVAGALFDIYETQTADAVREEIAGIIENMMLMLLAAGQLRTVAYVLAETQAVTSRARDMTPEQVNRLGNLPERLSAEEPLTQLLQALDETADLPDKSELTALFEQLRPAALRTVLSWLPKMQNAEIRALIEESANRLASANMPVLVKLIQSQDTTVSREAVRRSGSMKTPLAVAPLAKLLTESDDVGLRQFAVQALTDIGSPGALQALERSIADSDRDVRVAAVRTLGAKAYRGVFARLEPIVKGKQIRGADLTEKMAFFEAYGAMCGDGGVPFLDGLLNSKGLFGKKEDAELRACAAVALGRVGTTKARDSLQRALADEKDAVVRNAVNRAMKAGGGGT